MLQRTWPYGTTKRGKVIENIEQGKHYAQIVEDDTNEGHILIGGCEDRSAVAGDVGTLTFTKGGPTGGYWKFVKD